MSVELHEDAGGKIVAIKLTGKLTKEDYEHVTPAVERLIKQHGKVRMLVQLHDFHGWTAGALGGHQVRPETLPGHRTAGAGR